MASPLQLDDDDIVVGINVTPLVDITLVLLIIFMVTAKLVVGQGIPMDLPKAATAGVTQTVLTVSIDPQGRVFANGAPVVDASLRAMAAQLLNENPETRTVVQAAGATTHATVLHVIDELRRAGVVKIAFAADRVPPAEGAPE
jgi:biopolymer transport protein ExbD